MFTLFKLKILIGSILVTLMKIKIVPSILLHYKDHMKIKLLGRNKGATKIPQAFFFLTKMFVSPAGRSVIPANFAPLLSDAG